MLHVYDYLLPEWFPGPQVSLVVLAVSCAALWTAFDFFDFTHAPWFTQNSFLIYAMHSLVGASVSKILCPLLPAGPVYLSLAAVISFFGTVAILCSFGWLLNRYFPRIKRLLTGR